MLYNYTDIGRTQLNRDKTRDVPASFVAIEEPRAVRTVT